MEAMDNYKLRINEIIDKYFDLFLKNPNVTGFGRGNKIINGNITDIPSLIIFVKEKLSVHSINPYNVIPKFINGAITDIYEAGDCSTYDNEIRPAVGGVSIGTDISGNSGTLGYAVIDRIRKENLYLLSCAHVLAPNNKKEVPPQKIFQPSLEDGASELFSSIGRFCEFIPLVYGIPKRRVDGNEVDAAIALVGTNTYKNQKEWLDPRLLNNVIVSGTTVVKPGDLVWKIGRTTGKTEGKVIAINTAKIMNKSDPKRVVTYKNQTIVEVKSEKGDSGALGVTKFGNKAFGMLVGGDYSTSTYCDINRVLELLDVELANPLI